MAKIKGAIAITYKGIKFKSKLEQKCYMLLKANGLDASYEAEKITLMASFKFCDKTYLPITYTPDFVVIDKKGKKAYLECKGYPNDVFPVKMKLFLHLLVKEKNDARYFLIKTEEDILNTIKTLLYEETEENNIQRELLRLSRPKQQHATTVKGLSSKLLQRVYKRRKKTRGRYKIYKKG